MSMAQGDRLFALNPQTGATTTYTAPFGPATFQTIARAADNTLWVADSQDRIIHFNPAGGAFTAYPLPAATFTLPAYPFGVTVRDDGAVWFTCWTDRCIGRFNPGDATWQRFAPFGGLPDPPVEIAFSGDGFLWFTMRRETGNPGLVKLNPNTGAFDLWVNPYAGILNPYGITVMGGYVWFLDHHANLLVRFNPASSIFTIYSTSPSLVDPHFFVADPEGNLWMSGFVSATIARFNPSNQTFERVSLADPNSHPMGVSRGPAGEIWTAETFVAGSGGVARFTLRTWSSVPVFTPWGIVLFVVMIGVGGMLGLSKTRELREQRKIQL